MREIRTSGSMSGEGKRSDCHRLKQPRPSSTLPLQDPSMTHDDIKQKLILAGKVLVAEGQDDFTRGHISIRLPDNASLFFMKPHSVGLDELTMENILTIDLEGNVVAG